MQDYWHCKIIICGILICNIQFIITTNGLLTHSPRFTRIASIQ